jgi:hypothetical protein
MTNPASDLAKLISDLVDRKLASSIYGIPFPARVIEYDFKTRTATIQGLVNLADGQRGFIENLPIPGVPVMQYCSKNFKASFPLQKDDEGLAFITRIGIENWLMRGKTKDGKGQDEHTDTMGGMQNCFFLPCLMNWNEVFAAENGEDYFIEMEDTSATKKSEANKNPPPKLKLRITKDGKVEFSNTESSVKIDKFQISSDELDVTAAKQLNIKAKKLAITSEEKGKIDFNNVNLLKNISEQMDKLIEMQEKVASALSTLATAKMITAAPGAPSPFDPTVIAALKLSETEITAAVKQLKQLKSTFDGAYD